MVSIRYASRGTGCPECGGSVHMEQVRIAGGSLVSLPVDFLPWTGDRKALRLSQDREGHWFTNPWTGRFQAHVCGRTN